MSNLWAQAEMLLRIYAESLRKTVVLSLRHYLVLFTLFAYFAIYYGLVMITAPLGIIGGFIIGLAGDACASSFLVMVENIVKNQKFSVDNFKKSFWVYFFDVMGVFFVWWVANLLLAPIVASGQAWLVLAIQTAMFVLFNPMPELIYYDRHGTLELFSRAYAFIRDNWIEWFIPNVLLALGIYLIFKIPLPFAIVVKTVLYAFFLYFFMIFRGLLFASLYRSSRRMRLFQYRSQS